MSIPRRGVRGDFLQEGQSSRNPSNGFAGSHGGLDGFGSQGGDGEIVTLAVEAGDMPKVAPESLVPLAAIKVGTVQPTVATTNRSGDLAMRSLLIMPFSPYGQLTCSQLPAISVPVMGSKREVSRPQEIDLSPPLGPTE